jgi:diadenosine tetraphosphate (Ap4A) HIT family hydrolase
MLKLEEQTEETIHTYKDTPWCSNPKAYQNIVHEDDNVVVFKDRYPVTEGHLLFVPKKRTRRADITICFEYAYDWGVKGILDYKWEAFNVGINNGVAAGQSVMWPHVHLIPRRKGDTPNPRGGVRGVIPMNQDYAVPAPCSRTALVRDRYIDEIKTEMKGKRQGRNWDKVDDATWDKVVKRMRDKERREEKERKENDK